MVESFDAGDLFGAGAANKVPAANKPVNRRGMDLNIDKETSKPSRCPIRKSRRKAESESQESRKENYDIVQQGSLYAAIRAIRVIRGSPSLHSCQFVSIRGQRKKGWLACRHFSCMLVFMISWRMRIFSILSAILLFFAVLWLDYRTSIRVLRKRRSGCLNRSRRRAIRRLC